MRKLLSLLFLILFCSAIVSAQTHTEVTVEDAQTITGIKTFTTINCTNINAIRCISPSNPQGWAGADFGAQLNSAMAGLGGPGNVQIATGTYTPTTAINIPVGVVLQLAAGVTVLASATTTMLGQSGIVGPGACGDGDTAINCTTVWKMANATNLSPLILMQGKMAFIQNMVIDGNKTNNPTAGPLIKATYAVSGTAVSRMRISDSTIQNSKTDGLEALSSSVSNNEVAGFIMSHVMVINNDSDGAYVFNTGDLNAENQTQFENNGLGGGSFAPSYTTVNVSAATPNAVVTWVSGTKWSTDVSLSGRDVTVNNINWRDGASGTTPVHMTMQTPTSTTQFLLNCGNANQAACPGSLSGVTLRMGYGVELFNSGGNRFQNGDFGGNQLSGLRQFGNAAGGSTPSTESIINGNQFGNDFENDIQIDGWDVVGGVRGAFWEMINGNFFIDGAQRIVLNTYDAIYSQDGGGSHIIGNFFVNNQPAFRSAVRIHETAANRETQDFVVSNDTEGQTWTSLAFYTDAATITSFFGNKDRSLVDPSGGGRYMVRVNSAYLANNSSFWVQNAAASGFINAFKVDPSNNIHIADSNANQINLDKTVLTSALAPNGAGSFDVGLTGLPFGNLWLGTAATNNFKFQPASTTGARIITMADPLSPTTVALPMTIANGSTALTTALIATVACGTTVTVAATGVLTTDVIDTDFNAAVTAANMGLLTFHAWPTSGNVNFNYCNPTAGGLTPTAMTVNWSVRRP